jgi:hypothetical protein
LTQNE